MTDQNKNEIEVKKSNALIDSRQRLSAHQHRAFMLFITKIKKGDSPDKTYKLKWGELLTVSKGYLDSKAKIKELFDGMVTKPIHFQDGGTATYFSYVNVDPVPGLQEVHLRVDISIQKELFSLIGQYTLYSLECALNLDSSYHIRFYEILKSKQFLYNEHGPQPISLDFLKKALDCEGVATYAKWADFKRYIIDKAQKALELHTDIKFTWIPAKVGHKVTGIIVSIFENQKWQSTINALLPKKPCPPSPAPKRDFIRSGDVVIIDGDRCEVGPSVAEHKGKSIAIGTLTTMFKAGQIELVEEGRNDD